MPFRLLKSASEVEVMQKQQPQEPLTPQEPGYFSRVSGEYQKAGEEIVSGIKAATKGEISPISAGIRTAGEIAKASFAPITEVISPIIKKTTEKISDIPLIQKIATNPAISGVLDTMFGGLQKAEQWASQHPEAAKNLESLMNIGLLASGIRGEKAITPTIKTGLETIGEKATGVIPKIGEKLVIRGAEKDLSTAIEAVSPELKGKSLVRAYKEGALGGRTIEKSGITGIQAISEDLRTAQLGQRLSDILKSKNPVENLSVLGNEMKNTEARLQTIFSTDKTPVIKQAVNDVLDELKTNMPREFKAIKDSGRAFEDVVDFAKEKVNEANPTIKGLRIARNLFDRQAKTEYPNAYKDGYIDLKSPAGRAIKATRDSINEYMYNTAERGSELQKTIGRETDIFRAVDNIAPKAAKQEGTNWLQRISKKYPTTTNILKYGVGGIAAERILKDIGVPLP